MDNSKTIWIFASGNGSNAQVLFSYFEQHPTIRVGGVFCNNPEAGVIERAQTAGIPVYQLSNKELATEGNLLSLLQKHNPDFLILAGFLRKIPDEVISAYSDRIINIHPALLPKFGGMGMYGMHVHKAVKEAGEKESGITIHLVNEHYDEGKVLFQASVPLIESDTAEEIAHKVLVLEHDHFAAVCEKVIQETV